MDNEKYIVGKRKNKNVYFDKVEYYIIVDKMRLVIDYNKDK
jgi:hypothetical protein